MLFCTKGSKMRAHYNGLIPRNPFAQFHISPNVKEREHLTEDGIKKNMAHEFDNHTLALARNLFIFACFTALSFVDMKELTTDEIVEVNGEKWMIAKRHKTDVPLQVKLLDIPLQIIERYRPMQKDDLLFPDLNYRTVCKPLKKMIKKCEINKNINFLSAERLRFMAKCRPLRVYLRNAGNGKRSQSVSGSRPANRGMRFTTFKQ